MTKTTCVDHIDGPHDYVNWFVWAKEKQKTHSQRRCGECGLYKIWVPKK